jgi:dolichyl-phosphate beta-glucosyltransferase
MLTQSLFDYVMVVPFFNEEKRLDATYWRTLLNTPNICWIFVDDGSTDDGARQIMKMIDGTKNEIISIPKNSGKAFAVYFGLKYSLEKNYNPIGVGFLDFDNAFSSNEIVELFPLVTKKKLEGYQSFYASRSNLAGRLIQRSKFRHLVGRLIRSYLHIYLKELPNDTQCGLKIYYVNDLLKLILIPPKTRWFFDLEIYIRYRIHGNGRIVWEEPIKFWSDIRGGKLSLKSFLSVATDLIKISKILLEERANASLGGKTR